MTKGFLDLEGSKEFFLLLELEIFYITLEFWTSKPV